MIRPQQLRSGWITSLRSTVSLTVAQVEICRLLNNQYALGVQGVFYADAGFALGGAAITPVRRSAQFTQDHGEMNRQHLSIYIA